MAGYFTPSSGDNNAGVTQNNGLNPFGLTTNIINGGQECGRGHEDARSTSRLEYFNEWLNHFDLPRENTGL